MPDARPIEEQSQLSGYLRLAACLIALALGVWAGWDVYDQGPNLSGARLLLTLAIVGWFMAVVVSSLLARARPRSVSPAQEVSDDSSMFATTSPRLKAAGWLVFGAWYLPTNISVAIAILATHETWRILAAAPLTMIVAVILTQAAYRNVRRLILAT